LCQNQRQACRENGRKIKAFLREEGSSNQRFSKNPSEKMSLTFLKEELIMTKQEKQSEVNWRGIRTAIAPVGETKFHLTICPFDKDETLDRLADLAGKEGEPLLAFIFTGDPNEELEDYVEQRNRKIGRWEVNPYNNIIINTCHPKCKLKPGFKNAPCLKALIDYIDKNYIIFKDADVLF